jgi:stage V sporulation protein D (sporulation-specific penicillin-binding protein)
VDKIIDNDGNVISKHETEVRRTVISEDVADTVSKILIDGVNGDGGAKNAAVEGYDIAAKTGTSEKFDILDENGNSYLRIGSTVAYSINGDKGISAIIVVDEPTSQVKYGSVIAAPYISMLMEKILPYLEFQTKTPVSSITVDNYLGMNVNSVKSLMDEKNISYEIIGNGETVVAQTPSANDTITYPLSKILIYTENVEENSASVPNLVGLSAAEAIKSALNAGLNVHITGGTAAYPDGDDTVTEQSLPEGKSVKRGSVITIRTINTSYED